MDIINLKGKNAIVTGASRGIGRAIALKLAELGCNLVLNYRSDINSVQEVAKEIEAIGVKAVVVQGDVSSFEEAKKIVDAAKENLGSIDILVNNAGITKDTLIMRMKEEDFDKVIEVNLKGAFNCIRHTVPIMIKQKSGRIINISSVVGLSGNAGQVNYAAAKAGIIGITKSVAKEIASRGITVNAVAPGFIETDMTEVLGDKVKENIKASIPLNRLGEPVDIANTVAFLASDMSNYITGQVISVDGGMHI
ncbi:3-oxoacyl-[acyl-carrier-protein] reductase FabG [Clostridium homopropionicum DSM 5847]|uniref:3-oxoacyl-[acyl-carrier-protein] reductase n=1 Tax=Clostridium homopropionicum DSM 5847 TaxID=1121318 RepID=A0A0L6Z7W5_9CLOT|nr:3-oxoacyl-[acyl-carrier-protein] reductase [Clostridium homopropionicum]KOA19054.1 3-oxoacyl-[acyl-carrier-protein] reductase FabG [Clostridium homopropionicum DSM 5847]SFG91724.1 3-oxoacyl-[acyl-carrier-protein] reductase [Clostridium homopropionicum]